MTGFISAEQAALLHQSTVRVATLAEFRFVSETTRVWNGVGTLDVAGYPWRGLGSWGGLDDIPNLWGTESASITVKLSGVDPAHLAIAARGVADVQGQLALFWFQFFDSDWRLVGSRLPIWWGVMQRIVIERTEGDEESAGTRTVGVEIENPYADRGQTIGGRYTDSDQNYRKPGDKFCRYVSDQQSTALVWPDY